MSVVQSDQFNEVRAITVGTTGWTAEDLDDPAFERFWEDGRYEIIEGVLTRMPAAFFVGGRALLELVVIVRAHVKANHLGGDFALETDVILNNLRVPKVDAVYLSDEDLLQQKTANSRSRQPRGKYGRVRIAPMLAIESMSEGHEDHDRVVKRSWYAASGIANYWILDPLKKTLDCFVLESGNYRLAQKGRKNDRVRPEMFPGLVIDLSELWT